MNVKLEYYEGVVYSDLPAFVVDRDVIYMPPMKFPTVERDPLAPPVIRNHKFQRLEPELIGGEVYQVYREVV